MANQDGVYPNGTINTSTTTLTELVPDEQTRQDPEGGGDGEGKGDGQGLGQLLLRNARVLFHRYRKYIVVVGGIFVYLPIGVPWYFGNLASYLASYYRQRAVETGTLEGEGGLVDPQWIFSAFFICFSLAIVLSGYLSTALGTRPTLAVACLIHSGATFLSYFALQHSMIALIITFGAVGGLGAGLAYGPPMPLIARWLPDRVGLASGVLLMGFGGGAVFYNELITFVINPGNLKPDVTTRRTSYFSQAVVLDQVPVIFLVMGGLTLALQIIGLALIKDPGPEDEIDTVEEAELKPIAVKDKVKVMDKVKDKVKDRAVETVEMTEIDLQRDGTTPAPPQSQPERKAEPVELSPFEVVKTKDFYLLWLTLGLNHYGYVIKNNYYKEFGASEVDNDHLLTSIGTVSTVAVAVSRLFWGLVTDRAGIKMTVLLLASVTTVLTSFWFFTLRVGPGLYFVWTVMVTWTLAGAFLVFPLAALAAFGQKHYASNYGLISTAQIVMNLVSPPSVRALLETFGWFGVFSSIAVCNVIGTVASLFLSDM